MNANSVEEFLTRVDMAYCYLEHAKLKKDVEALTEALKREIEMNETLSNAIQNKNA